MKDFIKMYENFKTLFDSQDKQVHDYIKEQCELFF